MIHDMIGGGGGASLNFKVVGGTSAPASPKENTIWINTNTAVSSWDFSATQPYRRSKNKNMIVYPFYHTTRTENGLTFTDNKDGTVTVNGTATADTFFRVHYAKSEYVLELEPGTYTVSDVAGTSNGRLELLGSYDNQTTWSTLASCNNNGKATFTITKKAIVRASIKLYNGKKYSNVVFKPQLEKGSTATSFVKGDATGQVWITTGKFSTAPFNALKKNNITVYPISAKQYVSGAWADKTAKIYQNGAWADWWNGELFISGNQYEGFTGGWVRADYYKGNDDNTNTGTLTVDDTIYLKTSTGTYCKSVQTTNKIDLTNWKTLKYITTQYNKGEAAILITSAAGKVDIDNVAVATGSFVVGESSLDITELDGEYYIGAYVRNAAEVTIEQIYLEN